MSLRLLLAAALGALATSASAQGLNPADIGKPPTTSWPTYHGDYSARRFSTLDQINQSNVKNLSLAWTYRLNTGAAGAIIGGDGPTPVPGAPTIKASPLLHDGVLYFAVPDHVYAVDARTGREIWHYFWKTTGGIHIGNRGVGIYKDWVYFLTPDNFLVSLEMHTGKERWRKQIANVRREYFSSNAPIIIGDKLIIGTGGDSLDVEGYLEARNPDTGDLIWRWYSTPREGDPALASWPSEAAAKVGGGHPWMPGSYDAELGLYYVGTGQPNPVMAGQGRKGDNLWTSSIVAIDVNTGRPRWHYQLSPHDTHDYDATQNIVLIDGEWQGRPRKMLAQGFRGGWYYLFDRATGQYLTSAPMADTMNWNKGIDPRTGRPIPAPEKEPIVAGSLVSPSNPGVTNWPSPTFSPKTGLFYLGTTESYSIFYLFDNDPNPVGWGAIERPVGQIRTHLKALDYQTGKIVWQRELGYGPFGPTGTGAMGLLSTAGGLLFGHNGVGDFVAYRDTDGQPLWHASLPVNTSGPPASYLLDGRQHVVVGAGDTLYAFHLQ